MSSTFQTGGFRTNCIDCLDRTNVVQSLLASQNLSTVLHQYGVLSSPSTLELEREAPFQNVYRNAWADHANLISVQVSRTVISRFFIKYIAHKAQYISQKPDTRTIPSLPKRCHIRSPNKNVIQ